MRFPFFEGKLANLIAENALLKFFVLVIGTMELWNSHKIDQAMHYQRTELIPVGMDERVVLTSDHASQAYIRIFARIISNLAFNYNPATARGQFGELLQYFAPESFPQAKQEFFNMAETIEKTRVSSSFVINKPIEVDPEKKVITIEGPQRQWVDSNFVDTTNKVYLIRYKMVDGRFWVLSLEERKYGSQALGARTQPATTPMGGANAPK